jgi:hypothetical protein
MTEYIASSELVGRRPEDLADPLVLVGLETEVAPGLLPVRVQRGDGDGVERGAGHGHNLSGRAGDTDGDAG